MLVSPSLPRVATSDVEITGAAPPTWHAAQFTRHQRSLLSSSSRLRRCENGSDSVEAATPLKFLVTLGLFSDRVVECRPANDGGDGHRKSLRLGYSRPLVFFPNGRSTPPEKNAGVTASAVRSPLVSASPVHCPPAGATPAERNRRRLRGNGKVARLSRRRRTTCRLFRNMLPSDGGGGGPKTGLREAPRRSLFLVPRVGPPPEGGITGASPPAWRHQRFLICSSRRRRRCENATDSAEAATPRVFLATVGLCFD